MASLQRVAFMPDPALPPAQQAVSLAAAILRTARATRWADLDGVVPARVALYPGQLGLLREHLRVISYLTSTGVRSDGSKSLTSSLAYCSHCRRWLLVAGNAPKNCPLTLGCQGTMFKVPAAPRADLPEVEDGQA